MVTVLLTLCSELTFYFILCLCLSNYVLITDFCFITNTMKQTAHTTNNALVQDYICTAEIKCRAGDAPPT